MSYAVYLEGRDGHARGWPKVLEVLSLHATHADAAAAAQSDEAVAQVLRRGSAARAAVLLRVDTVAALRRYTDAAAARFGDPSEGSALEAALARSRDARVARV